MSLVVTDCSRDLQTWNVYIWEEHAVWSHEFPIDLVKQGLNAATSLLNPPVFTRVIWPLIYGQL